MAAACQACEAAKTQKHCPYFRAGCQGCAVRSLAGSIAYHESAKSGRLTEAYQKALQALYGDDWQQMHAAVKAEAARMAALG